MGYSTSRARQVEELSEALFRIADIEIRRGRDHRQHLGSKPFQSYDACGYKPSRIKVLQADEGRGCLPEVFAGSPPCRSAKAMDTMTVVLLYRFCNSMSSRRRAGPD
jgi:hypothetical protein